MLTLAKPTVNENTSTGYNVGAGSLYNAADTSKILQGDYTVKPIVLDTDEGDISKFLAKEYPQEAEIEHQIPQPMIPKDEIAFDEPNLTGEYPMTESTSLDDFNSLDLTMKEFTGDVFSKPIALETDSPLIGDVIQTAIPNTKTNMVNEVLPKTAEEKKKFNLWLLIIAAAVLLGVMYLSKNKI